MQTKFLPFGQTTVVADCLWKCAVLATEQTVNAAGHDQVPKSHLTSPTRLTAVLDSVGALLVCRGAFYPHRESIADVCAVLYCEVA